jgi:hypothetical protein
MTRGFFLFVMLAVTVEASAGKIVSLTGPTQITRSDVHIVGAVDTAVEMMDVVETLESRTGIVFQDETKVNVTEHSRLKIDSFVYDPNTGKGKIGLKTALGTVRYASGRIAHNNRENVNVQTPTASVAVRGTDFSMTVDEMGRSLIILLPSKTKEKLVGKIDVTTDAGTVTMDKAFQGTFVASTMSMPTPPVIFNLGEERIGNDLLLDGPKPLDTPKSSAQKTGDQRIDNHIQSQSTDEERVIQLIDSSKFVFVDDGPVSRVTNVISGNTIRVTVPQTAGATLTYEYVGGKATAKNGTGIGVNITIIQK